MLLLKNDHILLHGQRYCLLRDNPAQNIAHVISLDNKKALPETVSMTMLYANAEPLEYESNQAGKAMRTKRATPAQTKCRDYAWRLIEPLVDNIDILDKKTRWPLIEYHAERSGVSHNTLLKHLRRYWQRGQTLDALLADYDKCGTFDRTEHAVTGRPCVKPGSANYALRKKDLENFKAIIETYYMKDERKTVTDTLQRLYERYYSFTDGNGEVFIKPVEERPSRRQFEYFLHNNYSLEKRIRGRRGDKSFEMNNRPVLGTVAQQCRGVGHIYEIDATIADVTVVSSLNRADIIGRPTLYYIIDRYSRLIVGWYVGLESPSWSAALQAIFSISQSKRDLCNRLGIEYDETDWPAHGILPQEIYADRGEAMSNHSEQLANNLGTTVVNLPACRPDWKPLVEGRFKLIHQSISDSTPGYNPASNAAKRRSQDFSLEACLTIEEFEAIIVKSIIVHNRSVMPAYELNTQQLADKVTPTPIGVWNHGVISRTGQLTRHSEHALRMALLPEQPAVVTEKGIYVNGCYYAPPEGSRNDWFVRARTRRFNTQVTFDRRRVDTIYVHDTNEPGGYFVATLTARSEKYGGKSLDEVKKLQMLEKELKSTALSDNLQLRAELHQFTDPLVKNAKQLAEDAKKGTSKTSRRRNLVDARQLAQDFERDVSTVMPSSNSRNLPPSSAPGGFTPDKERVFLDKEPQHPKGKVIPITRTDPNPTEQSGDSSASPMTGTKPTLSDIARRARLALTDKNSTAPEASK
ncbi:DDE-type integrase/transposase/recombinase [Pusillimonas sp. TS35]|nr:DDE-type integrase/transposase/recombinase [Pusillimonas sp. TS35]